MRVLFSLNRFFFKYRWHLLGGIACVVLTNYFRILAPQITGYVINTVVAALDSPDVAQQKDFSNYDILVRKMVLLFDQYPFRRKILVAGILLLITAIISGLFMFLMRQTIIVMSRHIEYDQKNAIYDHYQKLDRSFYKKQAIGDLMNRISEDVSRVRMYTGPAVMYFINLAAVIGFSLFFMLRSDAKLTLISLSPLPILAVAIYFVNTIINRKSEKIQAQLSGLTAGTQESYSGIRVIKSYVQEKAMVRFFDQQSAEYRNNTLSLAKTEAIYFPSMALLVGLSTLIAVWAGGMAVIRGEEGASIGKIAEFVMYIQMLTFPVSAIGWTASMTQRAIASQRRINEFLHTEPEITNAPDAIRHTITGDIVFEKVNYIYPNTGIHAIQELDLHIRAGEKVAIIGATGSGKSTLAQLLTRMMDPTSGKILLDGIPLQQYHLQHMRRQQGYVPQETFLFSDTIRNNINFGGDDVSEEEVRNAAQIAGVWKDIESFPEKLNTLVGERGVTLSGGQKQRISIARALVNQPRMVILDDSLSAVDSTTERNILLALQTALQGKTAIIITHRIFSLMVFDRILVMEAGRVVEEGSHENLLKAKGKYFELYRKQQAEESAQKRVKGQS